MQRPSLKSLQVFAVAAKHQSFKAAAEELFVTQAAISQQIRQLEEQLQVQLFERTNKNSQLTAKGRTLFNQVALGLEQIYAGVRLIQGDVRPNSLRISCVRTFTTRWLLPNIQEFQQQHPAISVQLIPSNELEDFQGDSADVALRMGHGNYPGLMSKKLLAEDLIMVASPNLLNVRERKDPEVVFSKPFLMDSHANFSDALALCLNKYAIQAKDINIMMRSDDSNPIIDSAIAGLGVTIINAVMVSGALCSGHLVKVLDFAAESRFALYLVAPERNFSWPKVNVFEKWLKQKLSVEHG